MADMTRPRTKIRFRGKADMTLRRDPLLRLLLGVKRTCRFAAHMSAFDPKRTCGLTVTDDAGARRGLAFRRNYIRAVRYIASFDRR